MFIQTEETPNPATMKFLPGRLVIASGTLDIATAEAAAASPLAAELFKIDGVSGVFLAPDFITVTKAESKNWATLKPPILTVIMEYLTSGAPVLAASVGGAEDVPQASESDDPVVRKICDLLDLKIRPAVAQDGGDIVFHSFEDGVVYLHLRGACAGCPSSQMTLKAGVENMLRHYIPEVREVRQVTC